MRVFNVSHHKCATTSLHKAFQMLGFDSHHCEKLDELMKRHLEGTVADEPFFRLDNTAFNDLPITVMYRELYRLFCSDKFIFVRRDPASWLKSFRNHIVQNWTVPLSIHTLVYGYPIRASDFDEKICLRIYARLSEDIVNFFSDKPNFLLLELENLGWEPLCRFLGRPIPAEPFPHEKIGQSL